MSVSMNQNNIGSTGSNFMEGFNVRIQEAKFANGKYGSQAEITFYDKERAKAYSPQFYSLGKASKACSASDDGKTLNGPNGVKIGGKFGDFLTHLFEGGLPSDYIGDDITRLAGIEGYTTVIEKPNNMDGAEPGSTVKTIVFDTITNLSELTGATTEPAGLDGGMVEALQSLLTDTPEATTAVIGKVWPSGLDTAMKQTVATALGNTNVLTQGDTEGHWTYEGGMISK